MLLQVLDAIWLLLCEDQVQPFVLSKRLERVGGDVKGHAGVVPSSKSPRNAFQL